MSEDDGVRHLNATLDDKYTLTEGRILLSGVQALARLPLMQKQRDVAHNLNTAGFISGYRGSPLGGVDQTLWQAQKHLDAHDIVFQPGINEDLAATAVWGSQQLELSPQATRQGVFGLWYGKGPGVDRSGDVLKHANAAGTSRFGGVLAAVGDDHACKSSTLPHQSELTLMAAQIPVLVPSNVQDVLDYGLHGWAMSRFSGLWVALKMVSDIADASAIVDVAPSRPQITLPTDFALPADGVHLRWPDVPLEQELRLANAKIPAAIAYAKANKLNHAAWALPANTTPSLGLIATGKAYQDCLQALRLLNLTHEKAALLGIGLFKVAMSWPLEPDSITAFAQSFPTVFVVEEKRSLIEAQLKDMLYRLPDGTRPTIIGKEDEQGKALLPSTGEISILRLAHHIKARLAHKLGAEFAATLPDVAQPHEPLPVLAERKPHYCSGCPHNTSTKVPEGSRALAGIGCHYMALWMDRHTELVSQMGGEGVAWVGTAPFTDEAHVFCNLGDGTYFHSGILAIRASVSAGTNITYKVLYNDAVAMTGGQPVDGRLTVADLTHQIAAEGVKTIIVSSDDIDKYGLNSPFAAGTRIVDRHKLPQVQEELRTTKGVSVLIHDQTCAAEKRRRRKRGMMTDPAKRVFINERVCEGCGDCSTQSNCLSVVPVETEFGRKRKIEQSSCNKDFSCVDGLCPSFVTVEGEGLRPPPRHDVSQLPPPPPPPFLSPNQLDKPWHILVAGVGGTGIVTIGALIAMAAYIDGKAASVLDQTGLAQKGGAVFSHVQLANKASDLYAARHPQSSVDALIAADLVVSASTDSIKLLKDKACHILINTQETITSDFTRNREHSLPSAALAQRLCSKAADGQAYPLNVTDLAYKLFGDTLFANVFMLGYAAQKGMVPLSIIALEKAIRLNAAAVTTNLGAFTAGRLAAHDINSVLALLPPEQSSSIAPSDDLAEMIARRTALLTDYQGKAYAARYARMMHTMQEAEQRITGKAADMLTKTIAKNLFRLMYVKDEYEVARLYTDGVFADEIKRLFADNNRVKLHLAPPLFSAVDPITKRPQKRAFGPWIFTVLRLLAPLKLVRGSMLDIFGHTSERQRERQWLKDYEELLQEILTKLSPTTYDLCCQLAGVPEQIKGYGMVKEQSMQRAAAELAQLRARL